MSKLSKKGAHRLIYKCSRNIRSIQFVGYSSLKSCLSVSLLFLYLLFLRFTSLRYRVKQLSRRKICSGAAVFDLLFFGCSFPHAFFLKERACSSLHTSSRIRCKCAFFTCRALPEQAELLRICISVTLMSSFFFRKSSSPTTLDQRVSEKCPILWQRRHCFYISVRVLQAL